jgi:hypothetical protein
LKLIEEITKSVQYTHDCNIVIGDLNPFNILVNESMKYQFIDTDSYMTPGEKHSGRLLEEIRDYLNSGIVSKESDYFALAVIAFNLLTNTHPFKGIHKKYDSIAERMIRRIPIFDSDPNLIVPKCYKPIQNKNVQDQFVRIFKNGERFLINISNNTTIPYVQVVKTVVKTINDLNVYEIVKNATINEVIASDKLLLVRLQDKIHIYDVSIKGFSTFKFSIDIKPTDKYFINDDKIFILRNNKLYLVSNNGTENELNGVFVDEKILYTNQYGDILTIITENKQFDIFLNKLTVTSLYTHVKCDIKNIYGLGFTKTDGLVQNFDGNSFIRYNVNNNLNTVKFPKYINNVYQVNNVGIAQYIESGKVKHSLFTIKGLDVELLPTNIDHIKYIGYKQDSYIILPEDDKLKMIRTIDGQIIAEFDCHLVDDSSQVFMTNAGIVLRTGNDIWLLNKK